MSAAVPTYAQAITAHIAAPRSTVYQALLDPAAVRHWRVPDGMTSEVHEFDARVGGRFRISLSYDAPDTAGKSDGNIDTYRGIFTRLVQDTEVVERLEFESEDAALRGEMTITTTLTDVHGGTAVSIRHDGIPAAVSAEDNELGTRMALDKLAAYCMTP